MASLARAVVWDMGLQVRSLVYTSTVISTLVICGFVLILPVDELPATWATFFVFMDPATIGLSFVGAVVLMEKAQGTIVAVGVTPMPPWVYVASKTISLTLLTFASSRAPWSSATVVLPQSLAGLLGVFRLEGGILFGSF